MTESTQANTTDFVEMPAPSKEAVQAQADSDAARIELIDPSGPPPSKSAIAKTAKAEKARKEAIGVNVIDTHNERIADQPTQ